jgi:transcriptional regulator with XRE-family HTH domain
VQPSDPFEAYADSIGKLEGGLSRLHREDPDAFGLLGEQFAGDVSVLEVLGCVENGPSLGRKKIVALVRELRQRRGLSEAEMSRRCAFELAHYRELEAASWEPSAADMVKMSTVLRFPLQELFAAADLADYPSLAITQLDQLPARTLAQMADALVEEELAEFFARFP